MKPMTSTEQVEHVQTCLAIRSVVSMLRLTRNRDEDVAVALAHLENWLTENDGRWTK